MTMQQIFDLEANLSPSHVLCIRNALPPNATAEDYLNALVEATAESMAAMMNLKN